MAETQKKLKLRIAEKWTGTSIEYFLKHRETDLSRTKRVNQRHVCCSVHPPDAQMWFYLNV